MVTLTNEAMEAIRGLAVQRGTPENTSLRIAQDHNSARLRATFTQSPVTGDLIVDAPGVRLYLDATAARAFHGKALHAVPHPHGGVAFTLVDSDAIDA